jgi:penicillin G amidase
MWRITQLLEARPRHSLESLRAIQSDVVSLATQRLLPFVRSAKSQHPPAAAAQRELPVFDGTMAADRAAPQIFSAWARSSPRVLSPTRWAPSCTPKAWAAAAFAMRSKA